MNYFNHFSIKLTKKEIKNVTHIISQFHYNFFYLEEKTYYNCYYEKIGNNAPVKLEDLPFDIPDSWTWIRQKNICWLDNGDKVKGKKLPYLEAKVIRGKSEPTYIDTGVIVGPECKVILVDGENSGEIMTPPFEGYMGSTFKIFSAVKSINYEFLLFIFLLNKEKYKNSKIGAAIPHLNKELFRESLIAVPPLNEQERIVAKIIECEPLIIQYSIAEEKLSKLEDEFPDKLKKSILQYAIEGKLVKQDPNDEPASVLLERIKAEKERLIKEGKIKRDKNESYINQGDDKNYYEKIDSKLIPCDETTQITLPINWAFCYFGNVSTYGYTTTKMRLLLNSWLLELEDIASGSSVVKTRKYVEENTNLNSKVPFKSGMVLYSKLRPYLDKIVIADQDGIATSEIVPFYSLIDTDYLVTFLRSPYFLNRVTNLMYGVKMPRLGTQDMTMTIVPLPPLSEQKRIVKKILSINEIISG